MLGLEPELIAQRPKVVAMLPGFDMAPYDKCALYASALHHARTRPVTGVLGGDPEVRYAARA